MRRIRKTHLPWYERLAIVLRVSMDELDEGKHSRGRTLRKYAASIRRRRRKDQRKARRAHRYG